ncbi:MAG TPA: hypothetical protein VI756_07525 [Blastocatellia bacterium]
MLAEVLPATGIVVTEKVDEVDPAGTVMLEGTVAAEVLLDSRVTTAPPVGAAAVRVAVPCRETPPTTLLGFKLIEDSDTAAEAGCTVNSADCLDDL